jgi:hypothetical protein
MSEVLEIPRAGHLRIATALAMLKIENDGAEIAATNFWQTDIARAGAVYVSVNAGAFRLLLPRVFERALPDIATAREVIVLRGPWPEQARADAFELLFEDRSDSPFVIHIGAQQIDRMPLAADEGRRDLVCAVWTDGPKKRLALPASYRRVSRLPWLKPWR